MKKLSKRYAGFCVRKSMRYVADHPADFIRLGIMTGIALSSGDTCMASSTSASGGFFSGFDSVLKPLKSVSDFATLGLGPVLTGGGIFCLATGLIKGDYRDLIGKGAATTCGGAVFMNADSIVDGLYSGCLM